MVNLFVFHHEGLEEQEEGKMAPYSLLAPTASHPPKPDSTIKKAYSVTQFGRTAIDIFGDGD